MRATFRFPTGDERASAGHRVRLRLPPAATVADAKAQLYAKGGVPPPHRQVLIFAGEPLDDGRRPLKEIGVKGRVELQVRG